MFIKNAVQQVPLALQMVYRERAYQVAALLLGLLAVTVVGWIMQLISYFPGSGLFWNITPPRLIEALILAGSLGLLIPMQVYLLRKSKRSTAPISDNRKDLENSETSTPHLRSFAPGISGALGAAFGVACLVCCAPLFFPALLALLGASGSLLLTLNSRLVQWSGVLFLGSLLLCGVTLLLLAQNVTAACALSPTSGGKRKDDRGDPRPA